MNFPALFYAEFPRSQDSRYLKEREFKKKILSFSTVFLYVHTLTVCFEKIVKNDPKLGKNSLQNFLNGASKNRETEFG